MPIITDFNQKHIEIYDFYKDWLQTKLNVKTEIVGSAAVPMAGKEEIDILVICDDVKKTHKALEELLGHAVGPINNGIGYAKDRRKGIVAEFHIVKDGSGYIDHQRNIVTYLKEHPAQRRELESIKRANAHRGDEEYKAAKNAFYSTIKTSD